MYKEEKRAVKFYYGPDTEIYDSSYKSKYSLKGNIRPIFNPVVKTADTLTGLVCQKEIILTGNKDTLDILNKVWIENSMQSLKYEITRELILKRRSILEVYRQKNGALGIAKHSPENVEIKREGKKIRYAKISGEISTFNQETKKYETKKIKKEFFDEKGYRYIIETYGNETKDTPMAFPFIPVIEFLSDYNIDNMIEITDDINQKRAWLKNIAEMHGNPILEIAGEISKNDNLKQNKGFKGLQVPEQNTLKYIEMQGNIAKLMMDEIENLQNSLMNDYPEYALGKLLNGSNTSENTSLIRFSEITAKVNSLRSDLNEGLSELNRMILSLSGKSDIGIKIVFENLFKNEKAKADSEVELIRAQIVDAYRDINSIELLNRALERMGLKQVTESEWEFLSE